MHVDFEFTSVRQNREMDVHSRWVGVVFLYYQVPDSVISLMSVKRWLYNLKVGEDAIFTISNTRN